MGDEARDQRKQTLPRTFTNKKQNEIWVLFGEWGRIPKIHCTWIQFRLSSFLIEKVISSRATRRTIKKARNGYSLVELDSRGHAPKYPQNENAPYDKI